MKEEIRSFQVEGHVGFDSLPDQLVGTNAVRKGYVFNILCVGETGIGKSTLVDSLFSINSKGSESCEPSLSSTVQLKEHRHELREKGVTLNLTVVESVGFGDQLNKKDSYRAIEDYLDKQFEAYFREELKIERCLSIYRDTRIHACLYFICPTGNGLKAIDLLCMKKLHEKVNIIPVIGKSDALSKPELKTFKDNIMKELLANEVKIYEFPVDDESESTTGKAVGGELPLPFAVVGSRDFVRVGTKMMRGREYPWGNVILENEVHCDFVKLREMLIRTNMEDLKEQTHQFQYEKYRMGRLTQMGFNDDGASFQEMCIQKLHLQFQELSQTEEEMKHCFVSKIHKKEEELSRVEKQIREKYEDTKRHQLLESQKLEEFQKLMEDEIAEFHYLTEQYLAQQQPQKKLTSNHSTFSLGSLGRTKKSV